MFCQPDIVMHMIFSWRKNSADGPTVYASMEICATHLVDSPIAYASVSMSCVRGAWSELPA